VVIVSKQSHRSTSVIALLLAALALAGCGEATPGRDDTQARPDRVVLTYTGDPATTQSVTWRMPRGASEGVAQITPDAGSPNLAATAKRYTAPPESSELPGSYHSVTFEGLMPKTVYDYRVGDGTRWSPWAQFRTAASTAEPFEFIYLGDAQNGLYSYWARTVHAAVEVAPEARFIIHAGDLVENADADDEWAQWFGAAPAMLMSIPSVPATGNHEYARNRPDPGRHLSTHWRAQFALPVDDGLPASLAETVYKIDYQGVRVIVLNSMAGLEEGLDSQAAWLEQQLQTAGPRWTVVVFHHPVFASRRPAVDYPEIRDAFLPLFDRYGVDLVLQGHDHNYARGDTGSSADGQGEEAVRSVFVTSVAGAKMYGLDDSRWSQYQSFGARLVRAAENTQLFQVIRIDGDRLRFEAYTAAGELYDAFTLVRNENHNGMKRLINDDVVSTPERNCANTPPYDEAFEASLRRGRGATRFTACVQSESP
jgi:3',5'-cyclic AMP phosphodiesterase CpdA